MAIREYTDAKGRRRLFVEFEQDHVRVKHRLPHGSTRGEAAAYETKRRREIHARVHLGHQDEILLKDAINSWLEHEVPHLKDQRKPGQNALLLARFVRDRPLREVVEVAREATQAWTRTTTSAEQTLRVKSPSGGLGPATARPQEASTRNGSMTALSPATINRRLAVLKSAARYAWERGLIEQNLSGRIKALREENRREVYLTAAQVRSLAKHAPTKVTRSAIMIAAYSGLRASELLALTTADLSSDTLFVRKSKTEKPRAVPIVGLLRPYLRALPLGLSYRQLIGQFWVAREAAGLPHVRWHDLRHTTASLLINAGVDLYVVGKILGHSSTQTTARYAHLADATLRQAMRKLR